MNFKDLYICLILYISFTLIIKQVECGKFVKFEFGGRENMLFLPDNAESDAPLFVIIHGCSQSPIDIAESTRMNYIAERVNGYVLYPEQRFIDNMYRCWNWFLPYNHIRDYGEPELISSMTKEVLNKFKNIDRNKIFVAGLSSGGAMASILAVAYPDLYSGIGVASGLEYKAAQNVMEAYWAMKYGGPDPIAIGKQAFKDMGDRARAIRTIVFHGDADDVVYPINGEQAALSSVIMNSLAEVPDINRDPNITNHIVPGGREYSISDYIARGKVYVRKVIVKKMGHAWSGGSKGSSYSDPSGPDASKMMVSFWLNNNTILMNNL